MKPPRKSKASILRHKAESALKHDHPQLHFNEEEKDLSKLYYELEVHQIELQMQNEALEQSKLEMEQMAEKYQQLYDFAPTGYFTLTSAGVILDVNLAGAKMLGKDRSVLIQSNFAIHLNLESRFTFDQFINTLFVKEESQSCELSLSSQDDLLTYLHLIGRVELDTELCFLNVFDFTERKEITSLNKTLLNSLPYPAMYIHLKDKLILGANSAALKLGFKLGETCWQCINNLEFLSEKNKKIVAKYPKKTPAEFGVKCMFCLADQCMFEENEQVIEELHVFGLIWDVHWVKVNTEVYLHFFIDITEKVLSEETLRANELFLKQTQQIAMLGSYILDVVSGEWTSSEIMNAIFGIEKDFIKNVASWVGLLHPDWQMEMSRYFQEEVIGKKQKFDKEYQIIRPSDAQVRWVHGLGELVLNSESQPIKMIGTIQDITIRKKLELERNYLLASVENVPNRIVVKDLDLKVVSANKAWIHSKGELTIDNLIGKTDAELLGMSPELEPVRSYLEQDRRVLDLSSGEFLESEFPVLSFNGDERIDYLRRFPIFGDNGELICIGAIATDITERKKTEMALQKSEALFRLMTENSTDVISRSDLAGKFLYISPACYDILGYEPSMLMDRLITEFIHPDQLNDFEYFFKSNTCPILPAMIIYQIRCKNGMYRWMESNLKLVRSFENQEVMEIHASSRDVSKRMEIELKIKEMNQTLEQRVKERTVQLEALNKDLETFSYSISHDLRAPLRHICAFSDMLAEEAEDSLSEKGRHCLDVINDAAAKMGLLIDDLLEFSRTGRIELNRTSFVMRKAIDEAFDLLKPAVELRTLHLEISDLPTVFADYNLIRQVWVNLLDNAIKYTGTRANSLIQIDFSQNHHEYIFSIHDNGIGFDMKYADKLFGVFQRLHNSSSFTGTGIGLANVRQIILRHNGRTWAEAIVDQGATFYFSLPKFQKNEKN